MADKFKTFSDILLSFSNIRNRRVHTETTTGEMRDAFYSMKPPYGGFARLVPASTNIGTGGTYYKAAGTTEVTSTPYLMVMDQDNRLTYKGDTPRHFHIAVSVSFTCTGASQVVGFKIAKGGVVDDHSICRRNVTTGVDIGSTALHADILLAKDEYIELWVTNETSTNQVTVDEFYLFAMGMIV